MSIFVNASTVSGVNASRTAGVVAVGVTSGFTASSVLANTSSKNAATSLGDAALSVGLYSRAAVDGAVFSKAGLTILPSFLIGFPYRVDGATRNYGLDTEKIPQLNSNCKDGHADRYAQ